MSGKLAAAPAIKISSASKLEKAACPECKASLKFYRSDTPHIVRLQMVWDNLSCLGTEALARLG